MLEKNENIFYFDAHFHLADCMQAAWPFDKLRDHMPSNWAGCSCSHSIEEWEIVQALQSAVPEPVEGHGPQTNPAVPEPVEGHGPQTNPAVPEALEGPPKNIYLSYGLHPQSAGHINIKENADFLEQLLQQKKLHAIGEAGFDYFTLEFRDQATIQEEMFNLQLDLALQYNMPMVIHARKANHKLFEYSRQFKKLPAVLFHSFMGPAREAQSLIDHGINAYFSFGKQIMNNNKKVLDCAKHLPLKNLLLETDAPFQYLKGESFTSPQDITKIYDAFVELRDESRDDVFIQLRENFLELYEN